MHRIQKKSFSNVPDGRPHWFSRERKRQPARALAVLRGLVFLITASASTSFFGAAFICTAARALQTAPSTAVVVQPGAPGKPSKRLPATAMGKLPPRSYAEAEFMQGMIMHHAQAVEMTALISSHTGNKDLRRLGAHISSSQSDEIRFMKRWLAARGEPAFVAMPGMRDVHGQKAAAQSMDLKNMGSQKMDPQKMEAQNLDIQKMDRQKMDMHNMHMPGHAMALMPGMLTPEQMEALRKAKGPEFDHLFLSGMIQHHNGALTMVKDLFDTPGAGQDAELFDFATDVDSGQRAEIGIMQTMLEKKTSEEKQ